jgi:hypothetical protein
MSWGQSPGHGRFGLARAGGRQVALDQQQRELALRRRELAAVLLELVRGRTGRAQILALGDDSADLGRQRLDGMAQGALVTGRRHDVKVIGASYGFP